MPTSIVTPATNESTAPIQNDGGATFTSAFTVSGASYSGNGLAAASPGALALKAWNYPVELASQLTGASGQQTSQSLGIYQTYLHSGLIVSNVYAYQAVAGNTVSTTVSFAGLYYCNTASTAALVSSTAALSVTNLSTAVGFKTFPLSTPFTTVNAGQYYVGFLLQATTMPVFGALTSNMTPTIAAGPAAAAAQYPFAVNGTSLSTLPTTLTTSSNTLTNAVCTWIGLA
jgi:hypothetical protein